MARILVVEDEFLQSKNLEALCQLRGHRICGVAHSGEDAVKLAATRRPDIVMMDLKLSGRLDGVESAARIRVLRPCGLIFITAHTDDESMARMQALAPEAIIPKPVPENAMLEAVERCLARHPGEMGSRLL